ncbi:major facilitator superfamily transporter [Gregarina niphandrodes]|uniref:Hexose transporter 1 n=1 Tax=Gregarina niphandrodes TaxID=110365 RepID=A0A023B113_GRENI|nr:major facilitator superfamily transporter [Gregarina niphandrodes]EZG46262.1 major facilitator superfamily transporter [Gregarina niphandrodes]|eukprot:XP_011132332.1 major facilitator superfamily transporter [Gregarina niphandrodes]
MGYDLCIVAVVLDPIRQEFAVCAGGESLDGLGKAAPCLLNELFVAILAPGAMVASLFGGWAADRFGRRRILMLSDVFFFCAATTMSLAQTYSVMLAGRALLGVGIGMGFVVFPTYMAEVAPAAVRGVLVTCQEVAQCLGCLGAYAVAFFVNPRTQWRALLFFAGVPAVIQLIGTLVLPESPRWLVCKRKIPSAKRALERIAGHSPDPEHESRYTIVERFLVATPPSGYSDSSASRISRVRAARAVFQGADERGIGVDDIRDIEHEMRYHATLTRENSRVDNVTDFGSPYMPPPGSRQPPIQVLLALIEEEELRQLNKQKKRMERVKRDDEEMLAKFNEKRVSHVMYNLFRFKRWISLDHNPTVQKVRANIMPLLIAMGCAISQNFTGANTILYYSIDLFKMGGVCDTVLPGFMIGVVKLVGVLLMILCVERIGRRIPLLVGTGGTIMCHLALTYVYQTYNFEGDICAESTNQVPEGIVTLNMWLIWALMFFWNISWAGLMFVVASEVLPSNFRGVGMGITIATFWIFAFVFQLLFRTLILTITPEGTFALLSFTSFLVLLFVYFKVPDLTGKTLEEIH